MVAEYRKRKIPLDNIVLDWFYWKEDPGARTSSTRRASPIRKGMIDKVHAQNARFMISVWPKFYPAHRQLQGTRRRRVHVPRQHRGGRERLGGPGLHHLVLRSVFQGRARHVLAPGQREARRAGRGRLVDGRHRARSALQSRHRFDQGAHRPHGDGSGGAITSTPIRWCTAAVSTRVRAQRAPTSACSSSRARASPASSAMPPRCGAATSRRAGTISTTRSPRA